MTKQFAAAIAATVDGLGAVSHAEAQLVIADLLAARRESWVAWRLRNARRALKIQARRIAYLESAFGFMALRSKHDRLRAEIAELKLVGCAPADSCESLALPKVPAVIGIRRVLGL